MFQRKRQKRVISILVTVSLLAATAVTVTGVGAYTAKSLSDAVSRQQQASEANRSMAQSIADVTGVSVATLLKMKTDSKSWNDVLQEIQERGVENTQDMTDEELADKISGYGKEDIDEVSGLAQRVIFNLREITAKKSMQDLQMPAAIPTPGMPGREDECDFETLAAKFRKNQSIYLTLALKEQFGSFEQTMDEYLYSLQIEVDLELCLADADAYEKQVAQKGAQLLRTDAITVAEIEQTMLELLGTKETGDETTATAVPGPKEPDAGQPEEDILPKVGNPFQQEEKPTGPDVNPTQDRPVAAGEVYDEINRINQSTKPN